jgi:hypothetical protein
MSYLGLTPSAYCSGERRHQGGITNTGNTHARRAPLEGARAYRDPANVRRHLQLRLDKLPRPIEDTSGKAQIGLCKRSRQLSGRGKTLIKLWWPWAVSLSRSYGPWRSRSL